MSNKQNASESKSDSELIEEVLEQVAELDSEEVEVIESEDAQEAEVSVAELQAQLAKAANSTIFCTISRPFPGSPRIPAAGTTTLSKISSHCLSEAMVLSILHCIPWLSELIRNRLSPLSSVDRHKNQSAI